MKKFTILLMTCFSFIQQANAQTEIYGSKEYGRLFDLTYDQQVENKIYSISLNNHLMVSNDNGKNWDILYSHPDGNILNLKYIPSANALSFYSRNASVDKLFIYDINQKKISKTFTLPPQNADSQWIDEYSIWNDDTNIALVIQGYKIGLSGYAKVQYTKDAGKTWSEVYYTADNLNIFPSKVAIHPSNSSKLYMTMGNGNTDVDGGLWISENEGNSWTDKLPGVVLNPIAFNPENSNELYAGTGITFGLLPENLYKSTDAGETWNIVPFEWNDYLLNDIVSINYNPHNPQEIFILEDDEVVRSFDGGQTWTSKIYENAADNVEDYYYGTKASFNPFNSSEVVVTSNYYPLFSTDKGENFERIKTPYFLTSGNLHYVKTNDETNFYYGVQSGYVRYNPENNQEFAYNIRGLNISSIGGGTSIFPDYSKTGKLFTFSGGFMGSSLEVSSDYGETTNYLYNSFKSTLDNVTKIDDANIYASLSSLGASAEIVKINYSNLDDVQITNIPTPNEDGAIRSIILDSSNPSNLWISQQGGIYKTSNLGENWQRVSNGLENLNLDMDLIIKVAQNPLNKNEFILTSTNGLYKSVDNGDNWTKIYDGIIHNVAFSTINNGQIIAAIHDSDYSKFTIIYSNDSGESWETVDNNELYNPQTTSIYNSTTFNFLDKQAEIFVATGDLGVLKYTLDLENLSISNPIQVGKNATKIYPNPVKDVLNIDVISDQKIKSVEIFNLLGAKVNQSNKQQIDVNNLTKGIYLLKISLENGKTEQHKFIKE